LTTDGDIPWPDALRAATTRYDWNAVSVVVEHYVDHLRSVEGFVGQDEASQMLGLLRGVRRYADIQRSRTRCWATA